MIAVDDGLTAGHQDFADVLFLIGFVLALLASLCAALTSPAARWSPVLGWLAVAAIAIAWFML